MKVILLAPTPPPYGGIAGWTNRMKSVKLKNGWRVEVVDEKLIGSREVFGNKNKRKLLTEIKRSIRIWRQLINALKDKDAKVVHSCIPATTTGMLREYICAKISRLYGRKFIIHYRCTLPNMVKSKIGLLMFRLLTDKSDLVIVLNNLSQEFVKTNSNTKVKIIPNFIEESEITKEGTKKIAEKVKRILYVGGVIESKGCLDIINVSEEYPDIEFRLIGNPQKEIIEMIKPPNVVLLGEKNKLEVKRELEDADIFMFVSYYSGEGFSNALAEAMGQGLPCIASDWAANMDMIEDKGGIIVPVKDRESMIKAIGNLSYNKQLREKQSMWNIKKVKENYTSKIVTDMYVNEYEELIR